MLEALLWLASAIITVAAFLLDLSGLLPHWPWTKLELLGFTAFLVITFLKINALERQLKARPRLRIDTSDSNGNARLIPVLEHDENGHLAHEHEGFVRLLTVCPTAFVRNCVVRVNDLRQKGETCPGFTPVPLRWFGQDGPGSEVKSFAGRDFVLLLYRRPTCREWELQASVREGTGARLRYDPGRYEIELIVTADNAVSDVVVRGVVTVEATLDQVAFRRQPDLDRHRRHQQRE